MSRGKQYPAISLPKAVEAVQAIWDKNKKSSIDEGTLAMRFKNSLTSSAFYNKQRALKQYGLLKEQEQDFFLSERAISIVAPESSEERITAITTAANSPKLFMDLFKKYPHKPSEATLKASLEKKGCSAFAISVIIPSFRETHDYLVEVTSKGDETNSEIQTKKVENPISTEQKISKTVASTTNNFNLSNGSIVSLIIPNDLSTEDHEDIQVWIGLIMKRIKRGVQGTTNGDEE